jgi:NAD(P)-dependent dehydrogenase (short-subunit alcohol dehydrogenase family)
VVVTGGAKGIGLAAVRRFAALGDRVVALGRDEAALRALPATEAETRVCDVTDEATVTAVFGEIGAVDVLVNNAGMGESAPLHETTLASWQRHLDVNATGAFLCLRAVVPGMRERGSGAIVAVASTAGRVGVPYTTAYTASKHAVIGLTRAVAAELAGTGVRVNAVCPTFVRTEMTERSIAHIVARTGRGAQEAEDALAAASPLGRLLEPEEVADTIVFLASDAAASVSGQAWVMDGGGIQA